MKLAIIGLPGSGKSTISQALASQLNSNVISLPRCDIQSSEAFFEVIAALKEKKVENNWILDALPANIQQARMLEDESPVDYAVLLGINIGDSAHRQQGRRIDPDTNTIYHIFFNPPRGEGADVISRRLVMLEDDKDVDFLARTQDSIVSVEGVASFYMSRGKLLTFKSNTPPLELKDAILESIKAN